MNRIEVSVKVNETIYTLLQSWDLCTDYLSYGEACVPKHDLNLVDEKYYVNAKEVKPQELPNRVWSALDKLAEDADFDEEDLH
jgi:hypothetical protein